MTAIPMERAAYFALPSPVREAERVSTPERNTDDNERILTRPARVARSETERAG